MQFDELPVELHPVAAGPGVVVELDQAEIGARIHPHHQVEAGTRVVEVLSDLQRLPALAARLLDGEARRLGGGNRRHDRSTIPLNRAPHTEVGTPFLRITSAYQW
ncbi:hypothetical protein D3C72_2214780 [compost metagenome]